VGKSLEVQVILNEVPRQAVPLQQQVLRMLNYLTHRVLVSINSDHLFSEEANCISQSVSSDNLSLKTSISDV